jgi:hypothetical protein
VLMRQRYVQVLMSFTNRVRSPGVVVDAMKISTAT